MRIKEPSDSNKVEIILLNNGQARKSVRGMPWHQEPKKDVAIYDKPRLGESSLRSVDFRMGKPGR